MIFDKIDFILNKNLPNWKKILGPKTLENNTNKKKILIATLSGGHKVASTIESLLGVGLSLKGVNISYLLCDQFLESCIMKTQRHNVNSHKNKILNNKLCKDCFDCGQIAYRGTGFNFFKLSNYFNTVHNKKIREIMKKNKLLEKMTNFKLDNINIGEHVSANISRYYAVSNYKKERDIKLVAKNYFKSALKTFFSFKNLLIKNTFDTIIVNHGFYIPQGIISEIAKKNNIHFVTWTTGARKNSIIFSHNNMYYKDFVKEPVSKWKDININKVGNKITKYLNSKPLGTKDYLYKRNEVDMDIKNYFKKNNIDTSKVLIGLTTNVIWDAQLHYDNTIFKNMMEWVFETIKYFKKRQDLILIIRVHPTEVNSDRPAREKVADEIQKYFKRKIPKNIYIIKPEDTISTYSVLDNCNTILTYGTKLDIEYAARGYPVIVAGEAITRNKNLVIEPENRGKYFELLDKLPFKKVKRINNAKKFAYHYFFRRTISIKSLEENPFNFPPFKIKKNFINELPNDKNLKSICNSILEKHDFKAKYD